MITPRIAAILRLAAVLVVFAVAAAAPSCTTTPYTDRTQFMLLSEEEESQLGAQAFTQAVTEAQISKDPQANEVVTRVGRKIAAVADQDLVAAQRAPFTWEFVVFEDPATQNAFCLPGGKVVFYTGILPICQSENGVAVVMGHEVAHALARHGAERVSQQLATEATIQAALGGDAAAGQAAANALILLPFSRKHESEADEIGLYIMAKAGYDPRSAPKFWERMLGQSGGGDTPEFLSTHPSAETRIQQLNEWMPKALELYKP